MPIAAPGEGDFTVLPCRSEKRSAFRQWLRPSTVNARADLNAAYHQLEVAIPDKAGPRVKAMSLIEDAISEVNAGIAAGAR